MNYIEELWEKSINDAGDTVYSVISKKQFMRVLTEALGKQRELSCIAINNDKEHTYTELRSIILHNKLEESNG
jgi:guanylate kinase